MRLKNFVVIVCLVYASSLHAQTWVSMGLDSLQIGHDYTSADLLYAKGNLLYVGTNKGLYCSTNGGASWQKLLVATGLPDSVVNALAVDPQNPQTVYVSIGEISATFHKSNLYKSTDGGSSWKSVLDTAVIPNTLIVDVKLSPFNPNVVFAVNRAPAPGAGVFDGVFKSTDCGNSWKYVSAAFSSSSHGVKINIALDPTDSSRAYATGDTQFDLTFYASINTGSSWLAKAFISDGVVQQIMVDSRNIQTIYVVGGSARIHVSKNDGTSWTLDSGLIKNDPPYRGVYKLVQHPSYRDWFFAGTNDGIWLTRDNFTSWSYISNGLPDGKYYEVAVDSINGRVYTGGEKGLFRIDALTTASEEPKVLPWQFQLHQNYPNPFNSRTIIEFEIPRRETIRLEIFNSLGQQVAVLFEGLVDPGNQKVIFDATGLPTGLYFYRLKSSTTAITKPMLFLK